MVKVANAHLWVHDQDEALEFWTKKVGFEVRQDITMEELGGFRWLSVGAPGQDLSIALMAVPGPPVMDEDLGGPSLVHEGCAVRDVRVSRDDHDVEVRGVRRVPRDDAAGEDRRPRVAERGV